MKHLTLLLISIFLTNDIFSFPNEHQIEAKIEQGIAISEIEILKQIDYNVAKKKRYVSKVDFYRLLPKAHLAVRGEKMELLSLNFNNEIYDLQRVKLFSDNYRLVTSDGFEKSTPDIIFYHGYIQGKPKSSVAFSFSKNNMKGYITDERGTYEINKVKDDIYEGHYISDSVDQLTFTCHTDDNNNLDNKKTPKRPEIKSRQANNTDCVEIFFEADYTTFQDLGSSVINVENWLADIFNEVAILYANESIPIAISEIFVWTTATNPLDTTASTFEALRAFGHSRQNNYNGRLAHYVSTRPLGGGIAHVDALCASYSPSGSGPYGVSASLKIPTIPFPTYSWNVYVIAHELGHNFGSSHTHACVWDTNNDGIAMERIDDCSRGICYDSLNIIIPQNGGTIMSYCHLQSVGINFNNGFGALPSALINDNYLNTPCVTGGCDGTCNIVSINEVILDCYDNGTPVDFSDDIFEIEINPVGFNLTGTYNVTGSSTASGNYGTPLVLDNNGNGFTPGATISVIVTDSNDSNCSISVQAVIPSGCVSFNNCQDAFQVSLPYSGVDPGPTMGEGAQNSPATHSNWYKFVANCNSTVTVSSCLGGTDTRLWVYEGSCGNLILEDQADDECKTFPQSFYNLASETTFVVYDGNTYYIEWDDRWSDDEFDFTIEYNHTVCGPCEILDAGVLITDCDNNGTPNISTDDTYELSISPIAADFGSGYTITGDLNGTEIYGNTVSFSGLAAGSPDLNISITDNNDSNCSLNLTIADPGSCSFDAPLLSPDCNDFENGQLLPNWSGDIDGIGNSTWASWSVISGPSDPFDNTGPSSGYNNSDYYLFFDATSAQTSDTYTLYSPVYDLSNISSPQVSFATYMQGSCVGTLLIDIEEPAGSDNYTNIFSESGNIGEFWLPQIIQLCDVTETLISFRFTVVHCDGSSGVPVRGDIAIDEFCVEKGPDCSECAISNPGLIPGFCEDNGTPSNPTDDYAIVTLDPTGNLLGSGYTVSGDVSASGLYGSNTTFQFPVGVGDLDLTITDDVDANCINNFSVIDIGSCSDTPPNLAPICESFEPFIIPSVWYGDLSRNSNGALGKWNRRNGRLTANTGPTEGYNSEYFMFFSTGRSFDPLPAGEFAVLYTPTYNVNSLTNPMLSFASYFYGNCIGTLTVEMESPVYSGVYSTIYSQSGEVGDFWEIQSIPLCSLIDTLVAFKITATACDGSSGPVYEGDIAIDEFCVIDGPICNSCAIVDAAIIIDDCDINNSPFDDSDDIFSLSIMPSGYLLGSSYSISGDITANANYGSPLIIDNLPAGTGDLNITITDDDNTNCSFQMSIQDPGACSDSAPAIAPVCFDFEDGSLPQSWTGDVADNGLATHWSVDSGGTSTPDTGPSSGNNGSSEYLYFESSGTAASDSAIVYTTIFDISGLSNPYLNFSSHLYGECIGTLSIEIESPAASGNYVNVFSLAGEQGDIWQDHEVALCSFTESLIAIKIIGVACDGSAGAVFKGDMAIDDICLQEGPTCPCQDIIVQNSADVINGLYEANNLIQSAATVQSNGSATLKANTAVELLSNFHCPPNSELHLYIEACNNQ